MTQMLLFDSPVGKTETTLLPVASTSVNQQGQGMEKNVAAQLQHDSGMHHMGDLARLVLLRYELVAKRRAIMAARKAARG